MWTNVLLGLIVPWVIAAFFIKNNQLILATIYPFVSMLAFTFDILFVNLSFYEVEPGLEHGLVVSIPFNLGIFPVAGFLLLVLIHRFKRDFLIILLAAAFMTVLEWIGVAANNVHYHHGWNIGWTYLSYFAFMWMTNGYDKWLSRLWKKRTTNC